MYAKVRVRGKKGLKGGKNEKLRGGGSKRSLGGRGERVKSEKSKKPKYYFLLHWVIFRVNMYIECESKSKGEGGVKRGEE